MCVSIPVLRKPVLGGMYISWYLVSARGATFPLSPSADTTVTIHTLQIAYIPVVYSLRSKDTGNSVAMICSDRPEYNKPRVCLVRYILLEYPGIYFWGCPGIHSGVPGYIPYGYPGIYPGSTRVYTRVWQNIPGLVPGYPTVHTKTYMKYTLLHRPILQSTTAPKLHFRMEDVFFLILSTDLMWLR